MSDFATAYMPYINFIVLVVGGLFLKRIIKDKNSQIETLTKNSDSNKELLNSTSDLLNSTKVLVEMYDIQKFKEHLDFTINNLEERHKVEIEKAFKLSEQGVKDKILELASPWLVKYQELLKYQFNLLLQMSDEDLEKVYLILPENKEFMQYQLKAVKETGNLRELPKN
jgi:hypothetical protein